MSLGEAEEMLRRQQIKEIIIIPADLSRRLAARGQAEIRLVIDGSDTNIANLVYQYDQRILLDLNTGLLGAISLAMLSVSLLNFKRFISK